MLSLSEAFSAGMVNILNPPACSKLFLICITYKISIHRTQHVSYNTIRNPFSLRYYLLSPYNLSLHFGDNFSRKKCLEISVAVAIFFSPSVPFSGHKIKWCYCKVQNGSVRYLFCDRHTAYHVFNFNMHYPCSCSCVGVLCLLLHFFIFSFFHFLTEHNVNE
jgi:hypothetical protein